MKKAILSLTLISLIVCKLNAQNLSATIPVNANSDFINQATITGMKTVRSGNVAEKRSRNTDLKTLGTHLVNNNMETHKQLMKLVRENGVKFNRPTLNDTAPDSALIQYRGAEFDKVYIAAMIQQNQKQITLYENTAQNEPDAKLRSFAQQMLPKLKQNMAAVQKMAEQMKLTDNTNTGLVAANKN